MEQHECVTSNSEPVPTNLSQHWILELRVQVVDFLSNYRVCGVLEGFTPGEVAILLDEPVSEQRAVTVHLNSFTFEGQTLYCRPRGDRCEAHISIDDAEGTGLRKAPRFPVKLSAQLLSPNADPIAITILDISHDGLGVELPVPLETDQAIVVECGTVLVFGVVRHCRELSEGLFRAGAEMHHVLERNVDLPTSVPRLTFLQRAWGRRTQEGAATQSRRLAPLSF